ncbi:MULTISPECIES: LysE family transporter [Herbaspirillum]|jgi:homoserine/homoserine lactone efflux protein|uniref:LysE family transporter n=4 Tax=Herbaspirillum TaxID=963 RepID=A0AAJ2H4N2_9BURK|nr:MULTISPECIES: LysE family transporter [Herbaspirillum]MBW9332619.1 lysine transporter LysE [Herbaspirillum sp. RU 5E]MAF01058.1 lysine transporter LysE [Herbaspirillum sp.]MBN9356047.1 LysE family transporter [Herbaspirillum huttiense]MBO15474.1 lysine transporter LysE [Herbaspirillum sp.]MBP1316280.1 homoserine/homoserine lactone efflux protein [Herbaspirillum sp. 1130]|tara:strand:- start:585 stop:1244 length:660 start_codon:yes stop_codon:yes gene_type:complete
MAYQTWFAFFLAACVIAISPGSGAVLSMSHGLNYGLRRTTATILGLEIALVVVLIIAGAGVGSLLVASETAFNVVKIAGALYLIYLGFSQWRARVPSEQEGEALDNANAVARAQRGQHWWQRCMTGFLTNATNPKGIVFMVAVLPQFIDHERPLWLQLLVLAVTMVAVDLVVMHGYAFAASRLQRFFRSQKAIKAQNRFFGGVLMLVGAGLFFFKRTQH